MSNSSSHMKSQTRQLEEKLRANERIEKKTQTLYFRLLAKQSNHLVLFPNNCDDSRTHVTRNPVE